MGKWYLWYMKKHGALSILILVELTLHIRVEARAARSGDEQLQVMQNEGSI